ncbi:hypothetical protein CRE_13152 [Caenorhabditis remanei]|uniref:Uncharacterized protein n=1 Tax=Caenorhabditis remanei TaxID=31234 RepID=E3NLK9_CAERE|nr:hypothetical protein CRE_13152 [Caenorhabditis remanei]
MFPAYNAGGGGPSKQIPGPSNDLNSRTRYAVQVQAKKNLINEKNQLAQENEDAVFQQCGYGESSSDDECGGVRMKLEPNQQVAAEHVFTLPEKLKPGYGSRKSTTARIPPANSFHTFPDRPARNPYSDEPMEVDSESSTSWGRPTSSAASSSYSSRRRSRSRESSRRRRGDSRSRSRRDRSDDSRKKKKSKKSRRHRHSSSSESSSSDSDSRSRRRSSRRESPKRKSAVKRPKYEFLTLKEDYEILDLSAQILIRDTKFDPENYTLGCPKREVASMYLGCYQILGLEKEHNLFEVSNGAVERTCSADSYSDYFCAIFCNFF